MTLLDLPEGSATSPDLARRMREVLPTTWFPDSSPVLTAVLSGLANGWSVLFELLANVQAQTRIATATGVFLDLVAIDFFGGTLARRGNEPDETLRPRISRALLSDHVTREALNGAVVALTGRPPHIVESARIADTGAYNNAATLAYTKAGAWGSRNVPFQVFVKAYRPVGGGVAHCAGYGTPAGGYDVGAIQYTSHAMAASQVRDTDISQAIAATLPAATTAWVAVID